MLAGSDEMACRSACLARQSGRAGDGPDRLRRRSPDDVPACGPESSSPSCHLSGPAAGAAALRRHSRVRRFAWGRASARALLERWRAVPPLAGVVLLRRPLSLLLPTCTLLLLASAPAGHLGAPESRYFDTRLMKGMLKMKSMQICVRVAYLARQMSGSCSTPGAEAAPFACSRAARQTRILRR